MIRRLLLLSFLAVCAVTSLNAQVLFDNGSAINSPQTGIGGTDESVLQNNSLSMSTLGFSADMELGTRVADDFTIAPTDCYWNVDSIELFAYAVQPGDMNAPFESANFRIWDGTPGSSNVIFGDTAVNSFLNTSFINAYRVNESTSGTSNNLPLFRIVIVPTQQSVILEPGTFFLDWQVDTGAFVAPITITGTTATGNGMVRSGAGAWAAANDAGTATQQGFPFIVHGRKGITVDVMTDADSLCFGDSAQLTATPMFTGDTIFFNFEPDVQGWTEGAEAQTGNGDITLNAENWERQNTSAGAMPAQFESIAFGATNIDGSVPENSWIRSPELTLPDGDYTFSFDSYVANEAGTVNDFEEVEMCTGGPACLTPAGTWTTIIDAQGDMDLHDVSAHQVWNRVNLPFNIAGTTVYVRFRFDTNGPDGVAYTDTTGWFVDNVMVTKVVNTPSYAWLPAAGLDDATSATPKASPATSTTYTVTATVNGCEETDTVFVFVHTPVTLDAGVDSFVCPGDSVQLMATISDSTASIVWAPGATLSATDISNPIAFPTDTTVYTLTVTDSNTCSFVDSLTINAVPNPVVMAGMNDTICFGDTIQLGGAPTASGNGPFTYNWMPTMGLDSAMVANPMASPENGASYTVTVVDSNGCTAMDTVDVVTSNMTVVPTPDMEFCQGETVEIGNALNGSGVVGMLGVDWTPGDSLSDSTAVVTMANPMDTTTYIVVYADTISATQICTKSDTVTLNVLIGVFPDASAAPDTICQGDTVQLTATGGSVFVWTPAADLDNDTIAAPKATPSVTTTFTVNISAGNCGSGVDSVTVTVNPVPVIGLPTDTAYCAGDSVQLMAGAAEQYMWSPSEGLSSDTISNPFVSSDTSIMYTLVATDTSTTCSSTDSVSIIVNENPTADAGDTAIMCFGESVFLGGDTVAQNGTAPYMYLWTPDSLTTERPEVSPTDTTNYTLMVTDANGCMATDSVTVIVTDSVVVAFGFESDTLTQLTINFTDSSFADSSVERFWSFGDGSFENFEFSPSHTYSEPGLYFVCLSLFNTDSICTYETCKHIQVDSFASEEDTTINVRTFDIELSEVKLYPNPTTGFVQLELSPSLINGNAIMIEAVDLSGRRVFVQEVPEENAVGTTAINLDHLAPGTYFVRVQAGSDIAISKLIKQ